MDTTHHYGSPFVARGTFSTDPDGVKPTSRPASTMPARRAPAAVEGLARPGDVATMDKIGEG